MSLRPLEPLPPDTELVPQSEKRLARMWASFVADVQFCATAIKGEFADRGWYKMVSTTSAGISKVLNLGLSTGIVAAILFLYFSYAYPHLGKRWTAIIFLSLVVLALCWGIRAVRLFHERTVRELEGRRAEDIKNYNEAQLNVAASFREQIEGVKREHETGLAKLRTDLEEERAKNASPEITGEIKTVHVDALLDCFLSIEVRIRSGRAATTITDYKLTLKVSEQTFDAHDAPVEGYYLERKVYHPESWDTTSETIHEPLRDLAKDNNTLFVQGTHRDGWLRFVVLDTVEAGIVGAIAEGRQFLKEGVELTLTVYDARGGSHVIPYVSDGKPPSVVVRRQQPSGWRTGR